MLVLSRKPGERIVIPQHQLAITVVSVQGNKVRLGISAPAGVKVYREEICPGTRSPVGSELPGTATEA